MSGITACRPLRGPDGRPLLQNSNATVSLEIDVEANEASSRLGSIIALIVLVPLLVGSCWTFAQSLILEKQVGASTSNLVTSSGSLGSERGLDSASVVTDMVPLSNKDIEPGDDLYEEREVRSRGSSMVSAPQALCWALINYWVDVSTIKQKILRQEARKQILHNVHGYACPGSVTAIMGPSGSGKTTLLNVVAGRTSRGFLSGQRIYNGEPMEKERYLHSQ